MRSPLRVQSGATNCAIAVHVEDWIHPEYPDVTVYPKQEIQLNFSIDVPVNADPGTHWGTILIFAAPQGTGAGPAVRAGVGIALLVRVLGDVKEQMTIASFSGPKFVQEPPIELEARFRNEGTVHEAPAGAIEVRDMFGALVATGTLPQRNVLPGTVRKMSVSVGGGIWLGRYTATLHAAYGDQNEALPEATAIFWVVPWRKYGPWTLVIALLVGLIVWRRKRLPAAWHVLRTGEVPEESVT